MVKDLLEKVHESATTDKERLLKMQSFINDAGKAMLHAKAVARDMREQELRDQLTREAEKVIKVIKDLYNQF